MEQPTRLGLGQPFAANDNSGGGQTGDGESNVTPEEQAAYEKFVNKAYELIYNPKTLPAILQRLSGGKGGQAPGAPAPVNDNSQGGFSGNPSIDHLANTALLVVERVEAAAAKAGQKISGDVLFHGGEEIVQDLAEVAEEAGIHSYTEDEVEAAYLRSANMYSQNALQSGKVDKQTLNADFQQIVEADRQGQLEELLPGIGQYAGGSA